MVSGFISRLVILIFGTLYPAYASYKAVRTKNVKEYVKWMMYWIVFALFTCAETFTDLFLSFWFPFYYEIKIITVIYLLSPATKGSSILYRKFVHPVLTKREQEIDEYIAKAKEQGYHTMLNLGSKGVNYATSLIMQTAIKGLPNLPLTPSSDFLPAKNSEALDPFDLEDEYSTLKDWGENSIGQGGGGLVNQLRKSYSLSDLREEENETITDGGGSRLIRRNLEQILPDHKGFRYPDDEYYQQPVDGDREMLYSDLTSPYSNRDPLNFSMKPSKGDVLVRTASLGPSSRIRTRAVTKNGLSKRASLSEGGPTRSAVEPNESQNEAYNFSPSLPHSTSHSFPLISFPPYFLPEHQQMFKNVIHNQMFAFITHPELYSHVLNNKSVSLPNAFEGDLDCQNETFENHSVLISEESSNFFGEINAKDASNVSDEMQIESTGKTTENSAIEENKKKDKNLTDINTTEEKETVEKDLLPPICDILNGQEKQSQKRCGKYKKKPAPTPPTEQSISKSISNLTRDDDEESDFFTPNSSPKLSRKQCLSDLDVLPCKSDAETDGKCELQPGTAAELHKKHKAKKGDFNISKKFNIPKISFSLWHQKTGKKSSASDACSISSFESVSTRSETQSSTEIFIPLKDNHEIKDEENNTEEDLHLVSD